MQSLRHRFAGLVAPDRAVDLGRAALEIARIAYPDLDPAPALAELDRLAERVCAVTRPGADPVARADALLATLFEEAGFRGNQRDYYDPRNSFLNDVLARRLGIPISLAVLLMEVGRRAGVPVAGIGFPGHFLAQVPGADAPRLIDPFHGGATVTRDELEQRLRALAPRSATPRLDAVPASFLEPARPRAILARMLRNLLHVWRDRGDLVSALAAVDLLLVLFPDSPDELRTRGMLYAALECFAAAADDFRRYLALFPEAPDAGEVADRLARLRDTAPVFH